MRRPLNWTWTTVGEFIWEWLDSGGFVAGRAGLVGEDRRDVGQDDPTGAIGARRVGARFGQGKGIVRWRTIGAAAFECVQQRGGDCLPITAGTLLEQSRLHPRV